MIAGFTGTRKGMTPEQTENLAGILRDLEPSEFHHGDCVGADSQAHDLAMLMSPRPTIVVHPPDKSWYRAYKEGDVTEEPRPYLDRDRDIVEAADVLVAAPGGPEERRSGTWYTVRQARKSNKGLIIVWPDGGIEYESFNRGGEDV